MLSADEISVSEIHVDAIDDDVINVEWLRDRGVVFNAEEPEESEKRFEEETVLDQANHLAEEFLARMEQEVSSCPEAVSSGAYSRFQDIFSHALLFALDPATPEKLKEFRRLLADAEAAWREAKKEAGEMVSFSVEPAQTLSEKLEKPETWEKDGYFLLHSSLFSEDIAVVRDLLCCERIPFEDLRKCAAVYTASEITALKDTSEDELRRFHAEKKRSFFERIPHSTETAAKPVNVEKGVAMKEREVCVQEALFPEEASQVAETPAFRSLWADWLDAIQVKVINDLKSWKRAVCEAKEAGVCGLDTETTGLDPHLNRLRLVQLAVPVFPDGVPKDQRYLVKADRKAETPGENDWKCPAEGVSAVSYVLDLFALEERAGQDAVREAVRSFEDLVASEEVVKIFHNAAFDLSFLRVAVGRRIKVSRLFDTMIASQLVTAGDFIPEAQLSGWCEKNKITKTKSKNGKVVYLDEHNHEIKLHHDTQKRVRPIYPSHSLQQVAHRHLEIWMEKEGLQNSDWGIASDLSEEQTIYAGRDAAVLLPLREILIQLLLRNRLVETAQIEFDCIPAVVEIKTAGMHFDAPRAREIQARAEAKCEESRKRLIEIARGSGFAATPKKSQKKRVGLPYDLNPDSSVDVVECLRTLGEREGILDGDRFIVGGEEFPIKSMDDTLSRLSSRLPDGSLMREFIENLRKYRSAKKTCDFTKKWLDLLHKTTGRLHPSLRQINPQGVGRFSASSPNLQQAPRGSDIRALFRAPESRKLVVADYSGIEMRIMAQLSGDKAMIAAFREGADIHKRTASVISGKPIEEVTKEERQASKACFSADTEILTEKGWVRFDEYDGKTPVAQFVLEDFEYNPPRSPGNRWVGSRKRRCIGLGKIEFVQSVAFYAFEDRELVHFADRNVDLLVTPNHEVIWIDNNSRPRKLRADKVNAGNVRYFIAAGFYEHERFALSEAETRVLAMAVADGSFKRRKGCVCFGFSKPRKIERCRSLLKACGVEFNEAVYSNGKHGTATHFIVSDKEFVSKLLQYVSEDKDLKLEAVFDLNPVWYLDEAKYWDGCVRSRGKRGERVVLATTRRQTADVMQMMAVLAGVPSVLKEEDNLDCTRSKIYVLSYRLPFSPYPLWRFGGKKKGQLFEAVPGKHKVYCVQVPSGAIVVRRNGKVVVCGNCNFGLIYGMSAETLRLYAETSYGVKMTLAEAAAAREAFFRAYPNIAAWHARQDKKAFESSFLSIWRHDYTRGIYAEKRPCIRTLSGRLRVWPVVERERRNGSGTYLRKVGAFTELYNSPDQGSGADMIKLAMSLLYQELLARGWEDVFIVGCVHDELVLEAPVGKSEEAAGLLSAVMKRAGETFLPNVPVEVEGLAANSWAEK